MALTFAEAAEKVGCNRELFRVFPAPVSHQLVQQDAHTDAMVAELRARLDEMRSDRDAWREQAIRLTNALPKTEAVAEAGLAPVPALCPGIEPKPKPRQPKPRQTLWQWLKG